MRLDELGLNVDVTGDCYDDVYIIIKEHPSIALNKCPREERLKEWITEGQYKMHAWPIELAHRQCKIHRAYVEQNNLYVIVRMEDEENQIYLADFLNLNSRIPVVIVDGRKPDKQPTLYQRLQPTWDLVEKYGDCVVTGYKLEDHEFVTEKEFITEYGNTIIKPAMIITVVRGGL